MRKKVEKDFENRFRKQLLKHDPEIEFLKMPMMSGRGIPDRYIQRPSYYTGWVEFKFKHIARSTYDDIFNPKFKDKTLTTGLTLLQQGFFKQEVASLGNVIGLLGLYVEDGDILIIVPLTLPRSEITYNRIVTRGHVLNWKDDWDPLTILDEVF